MRTGALSRAVTIYTPYNPHNVYHPRLHPLPAPVPEPPAALRTLLSHSDRRLTL